MYSLDQIADMLESAPRYGGTNTNAIAADDGTAHKVDRYVRLSDSITKAIIASLRIHARGDPPNAVSLEHRESRCL